MQPFALKLTAGVGSLLATGACAGVVALDPKPAAAPLRPPVNPATAISGDSGSAAAAVPGGLQIPATPVCRGNNGHAATMTTAVQQALQQVQQAPDKAARAAILAQLPADVRTQVVAVLAPKSSQIKGCSTSAGNQGAGGGVIAPGVVDMPASSSTITDTYVS